MYTKKLFVLGSQEVVLALASYVRKNAAESDLLSGELNNSKTKLSWKDDGTVEVYVEVK